MACRFRLLSCGGMLLGLAACSVQPPPRCPVPPTVSAPAPLHQKAAGFQRLIAEDLSPHWPFGSLVTVIFSAPLPAPGGGPSPAVTGFDDPQDSAIWTGIYAAAQAFRYAALAPLETAERAAALDAVRGAVASLHTLATTPGRPGVLARIVTADLQVLGITTCVAEGSNPCFPVDRDGETIYWLGRTSRDQYTGWFFGEAIAYRLVDDPQIRATIRGDVEAMITAIRADGYKLRGPNGEPNEGSSSEVDPLMRLTWHLIAASILDRPKYWRWYQEQVADGQVERAFLEDSVSWTNRYFEYYGFNLSFLNSYNLILLERQTERQALYRRMFERELYRFVAGTQNVFFDSIALAVGGADAGRHGGAGPRGPRPFPRAAQRLVVRPAAAGAARPDLGASRRPQPAAGVCAQAAVFPSARAAYPLDQRCRQDFLWQQTPYAVDCCCCCGGKESGSSSPTSYSARYCPPLKNGGLQCPSGSMVFPGADYLVAYWMGRYHGFLRADE